MPHFFFRVIALLGFALGSFVAHAQSGSPQGMTRTEVGQGLQWRGQNLQGQAIGPEQLRGKVHVVFVWSTGCAVCRSALPELRANAAGWKDKPFALVTLNVDAERADWQGYEALVSRTAMPPPNLLPLWQPQASTSARLPMTWVVDAQGRVVARFEGRMAPQAWDAVAELLL